MSSYYLKFFILVIESKPGGLVLPPLTQNVLGTVSLHSWEFFSPGLLGILSGNFLSDRNSGISLSLLQSLSLDLLDFP